MAVIESPTTAALAEVDTVHKAQRVSVRPLEALGAYRLSAQSGLLTGVAAATATAGHLFAFRWTHATQLAVLTFMRLKMQTITGFTAAQEVGFDVTIARSYSASHAGGTALSAAGAGGFKKRASYPTSAVGDIRIGAAAALTAGTHTLDAVPMAVDSYADLAAAATVPKGNANLQIDFGQAQDHPIVLATNEGLVVRNLILMGAGGTVRLTVEMGWYEVAAY